MVRRLPVIQSRPEANPHASRSTFRWVLLGAALALALWAAASSVLVPLGARLAPGVSSRDAMAGAEGSAETPAIASEAALVAVALPAALGFVLSVGVSAFLVTRFGPPRRPRLGTGVGAAAAAIAWVVALALGATRDPLVQLAALAALFVLGALSGYGAGRLGARRVGRVASDTRGD